MAETSSLKALLSASVGPDDEIGEYIGDVRATSKDSTGSFCADETNIAENDSNSAITVTMTTTVTIAAAAVAAAMIINLTTNTRKENCRCSCWERVCLSQG